MEQKQKLEPKSIYDYTKILEEIPDYDEVRGIFLACQIPEWEMVKEEVTNEVIASDLYQFQTTSDKKAMLQFALAGAKRNHEFYKKALEICKRSGLDCCRMVEYIGNYPTSYPTPEESEKNKEIEKLLEKYDIMPSYYAYGDKDLLQITGDDINRIDDTMTRSLNAAKKLLDLSHIPATYFTLNKEEEYLNLVAEEVSFPESVYQKDGKSYRKNRKMYLKKQGLLS